MFSKLVVLVDADVDVHDQAAVWAAVSSHVDPESDVFFAEGPSDPFDPAGVEVGLARRMAIDATAKLPHPLGFDAHVLDTEKEGMRSAGMLEEIM